MLQRRWEQLLADNRQFTRDMIELSNLRARERMRFMREERLHLHDAEARRRAEEEWARTHDLLAERRAQRQALLRLLDCLGPPPPDAA